MPAKPRLLFVISAAAWIAVSLVAPSASLVRPPTT